MQQPNNGHSDKDQIRRAIALISEPAWARGDVVELRALNTVKGTISGYFDSEHREQFITAAEQLSGHAQGVYLTLNPVQRDCLARAANRTNAYVRNTTGDREITHRHWLLVDADPERPSGISANDREHELALERSHQICDWLRQQQWPDPIIADSGNGGHLLYRVDLPADDGGLTQRVLQALNKRFGDDAVKVDLTVHNPARISKLYGTQACKGDSVPDRPHRIAEIIEAPTTMEVVPLELLEAVANAAHAAPEASAPSVSCSPSPSANEFNVLEYLQSHGVEVGKSKPYAEGGTLWELKCCPWRPSESDGGPFVIQFADGNVTAGCKHSKCQGKGWDDLRDVIDPGWREAAKKDPSQRQSVAQKIVALASGDELFYTAENMPYVTIITDNRHQTWQVNGPDYRLILRGRFYKTGNVANDSALDDAIANLQAKALFEGPQRSVHVRTAQTDGKLYVDLCNNDWEVVEISPDGWKVVSPSPVKFVRKAGMLPLPKPVEGGNVEQLRPFINVTDDDWPLAIAWVIAAIRPTGPYPILVVNGEQGSCKSTTCRRLRSLIDPNVAPLRCAPRDDQTLMIWASNSHVIALDNLSLFPTWLSDAMCRLSTGGGYSQRALYSDDGEKIFFSVRPQIINGIGDIATRSDFLDRALLIQSPVMDQSTRKSEQQLDQEFAAVYPSILGALFTAASMGLRQLPRISQQQWELPRLADFAKWMLAVESALGWRSGLFLDVLKRNEDASHESAVGNSLVAETVRKFVEAKKEWSGTSSDLLGELNRFVDEPTKRRDGWPVDSRSLSSKLRELAPNLRYVGADIQFHDNKRPKLVELRAKPRSFLSKFASRMRVMCFDSDIPLPIKRTCTRLSQFWVVATLPASVAPVAVPPLTLDFSDGMQTVREQ